MDYVHETSIDYLIFCFFTGIFHESVICGLRYYDQPGWKNTANFIEFHLNLWKILNVKTVPEIINLCNRGGLSFPSEMAFVITCLGYCAFDALMSNSSSKTSFLKLTFQRDSFVSAVEKRCSGDEFVKNLVTVSCESGHRPFRSIIFKLFNCLCNRFCKDSNDCPREKIASARKLKKHL